MIGWALRWLGFVCGVALLWAAVVDLGPRLEPAKVAGADARTAITTDATATAPAVGILVYPADARGEVILDAVVNGAPVRFLVDTGASLVTLTTGDARAAGLDPRQLVFNARASTANGEVAMAPVTLREVRLGQLVIANVPAAVIANLRISLLGMSFLSRLQGYEMRGGKLTVAWELVIARSSRAPRPPRWTACRDRRLAKAPGQPGRSPPTRQAGSGSGCNPRGAGPG